MVRSVVKSFSIICTNKPFLIYLYAVTTNRIVMNKSSYLISGTLVMLFIAGLVIFVLNVYDAPMIPMYNSTAVAENGDTVCVCSDVRYGNKERNVLDIYIPAKADKEREHGLMLFLHGGSWTSGDKASMASECRYFADRGYVTATMNYSFLNMAGEEKTDFTTMLTEIATSISTIKGYLMAQGINITKVALSGYSAGAHLAMLYGYSMGAQSPLPVVFVHSKAGPADFSTFDLTTEDAKAMMTKMGPEGASPEDIARSEEFVRLMHSISPVSYVNGDTPPTLLSYGRQDTLVVWENVVSLVNAFGATGVEYKLVEYPNSNHGLDKDADSSRHSLEAMNEYAATYFGY